MANKLLINLWPKQFKDILKYVWNHYFDGYSMKSYAQEGEDMVLRRLFENQPPGFCVDIGAHHPMRFSNTYYFYKLGWHGINIEAMPGSKKLFEKFRPKDINIEKAISNKNKPLTYYIFNEPALNGFSQSTSNQGCESENYAVIDKIQLETCTLKEVLDEWLPPNQQIDIFNIDVEGMELEVLQSNDWLRYRPRVVLVEIRELPIQEILKSKIHSHLESKNYMLFAKTGNTVIYKSPEISF